MEDISISVYDGRYSMSNLIKFAESETNRERIYR